MTGGRANAQASGEASNAAQQHVIGAGLGPSPLAQHTISVAQLLSGTEPCLDVAKGQ